MTIYKFKSGNHIITTRKDPRNDFYHKYINPNEKIEMIEIIEDSEATEE